MDSILDWLRDPGLKIVAILLVTLVVQLFMGSLIRKLIARSIALDKDATERDIELRQKTISSIVVHTATLALWTVATIMMLSTAGVNVAPLLAGAGVVGLAIGFGTQSLVKDFIAGLFIVMENQYRVGDSITINGVSGKVEEITMRITILRDLDGNRHYIPNGKIDFATNKTMEFSKVNMKIGIGYDSDIDKVEKIVNRVGKEMTEDEVWHSDILEAPHFLRISSFGDSAVEIMIVGRTEPARQWAVAGELRRRIKKTFEKEGVDIPFNQLVIHSKK